MKMADSYYQYPTNFKIGGESVSGTKVRATFGGPGEYVGQRRII